MKNYSKKEKTFQPRFLDNGMVNLANENTTAKKIAQLKVTAAGLSFSDSFASLDEKEAFLERMEQNKRSSHSTFY